MAGLRTPGLGLGTWLFGCWVCQKPWLSRHHLQGTKSGGDELDGADGKIPTPTLRRGSGWGTFVLGNHLPPRAPRQEASVRSPEPGD